MSSIQPVSLAAYRRAVSVRDLTDPGQGPHALQLLVDVIVAAVSRTLGVSVQRERANPVIPIEDNYDRLRYPAEGKARDARHTRYVSDRLLLRTQTSAMVPSALERLRISPDAPDWLLVCPGIVYRRDEINRQHAAEPHQLDLWRIRRGPALDRTHLEALIQTLLTAVLPGVPQRLLPAEHPYTLNGLQIDVQLGEEWLEIGECGLAHPEILAAAGWAPPAHSGLALGLGLDRLLMLKKGIDDIRLLRSTDPRVAAQLLDLEPYRPVSHMPAVTRDLSVMVPEDCDREELGDRVRTALGERAPAVEAIEVRAETPYEELPLGARERMGARPGQKNLLLRVVLRDLERTLTHAQANALRDAIYRAVHHGDRQELACA